MNKKERRLALATALQSAAADTVVVDDMAQAAGECRGLEHLHTWTRYMPWLPLPATCRSSAGSMGCTAAGCCRALCVKGSAPAASCLVVLASRGCAAAKRCSAASSQSACLGPQEIKQSSCILRRRHTWRTDMHAGFTHIPAASPHPTAQLTNASHAACRLSAIPTPSPPRHTSRPYPMCPSPAAAATAPPIPHPHS